MEFKKMKERMVNNFKHLSLGFPFEVDIDKDYLWNLYLDSFPEGTNTIYRKRREYDCSCCRNFIKNIGGILFIDENLNTHSIFEFDTESDVFQPVMDTLDAYVKSRPISDVYLNDSHIVGTDKNRELNPDGSVTTWEHFCLTLPYQWVEKRADIPTKKARLRDRRNVFRRSLDEITRDAIDTVLELINSNTLYKGEEWKTALNCFKSHKNVYDTIPDEKKPLYAWLHSRSAGDVLGKIRNHSIGVLLVDISMGMDLDAAVRRYEKIVAPSNYKRPNAIFTKKMLDDAKKTITELGYMDSLQRRYATLDDITVNNILFSNRDSAKRLSNDIFDDMMADVNIDPKKFSKVEEIGIDKFVTDVLPTAKEVEVLLENRHSQNMVSLIAPVNKDSKTMFKWNNNFSWAYTGNITDSDIRENVKMAGGNVDGVLRFSIQWNDGAEYDGNDVDAHCVTPVGNHIYYHNKRCLTTNGSLDVDIFNPDRNKAAVENITWPNKHRMVPGEYGFFVNCYSNRGGKSGFRAEIEFDGKTYSYDYNKPLRQNETIHVATVHLDMNGNFTINEKLKSSQSSREVWGLKTNAFIPVSVVMYSPNYWDEQNGIGHRHYFFMLKDCINPESPNGFYNEFLKHDLEQHKRVFEALGSKMAVESSDDQLSGIGFSATKRNELVVKVKGATERIMKVKF